MKRQLPRLQADEEAEKFVAESDLSEYDLYDMRIVQFEFQPKSERVNFRIPREPLDAVKAAAAIVGVPYPRFYPSDTRSGRATPEQEAVT